MLKIIALLQLLLLGVIEAQMTVKRSKTFTVTHISPMGRLLTLADGFKDNIKLTLECTVDGTDEPTDKEARIYYFNNV